MSSVVFPKFTAEEQRRAIILSKMLQKAPHLVGSVPAEYLPEFTLLFMTDKSINTTPTDTDATSILDVVESMIIEIQDFRKLTVKMDPGERATSLKTQASLLEKWISIKEKTNNLKEMSEFQSIIIGFMDEVCTVDQRATLMKRIQHLNSLEQKKL